MVSTRPAVEQVQGLLILADKRGPQGQFLYRRWYRSNHDTDFDVSAIASPEVPVSASLLRVDLEGAKNTPRLSASMVCCNKIHYNVLYSFLYQSNVLFCVIPNYTISNYIALFQAISCCILSCCTVLCCTML